MIEWDNLDEEQKERFLQFLRTTFSYSNKQLSCLSGDEEMTYELFKSCLTVCVRVNDIKEFSGVCGQFPIFFEQLNKEIEEIERSI